MRRGYPGTWGVALGGLVVATCATLLIVGPWPGDNGSRAPRTEGAAQPSVLAASSTEQVLFAPSSALVKAFDGPILAFPSDAKTSGKPSGGTAATAGKGTSQSKTSGGSGSSRADMVREAALTPAPRPATTPGITQAELNARREAIEAGQHSVEAVNDVDQTGGGSTP